MQPDKVWVRLPRTVRSDLPWCGLFAPPGVYLAESNPHGALSVRCEGGELLGIKPSEFYFSEPPPKGDSDHA